MILTAAGCEGPSILERIQSNVETLDITPDDLEERLAPFERIALVVENPRGSVRVATSARYDPEIKIRWIWGSDMDGRARDTPPLQYRFAVEPGPDGRGALRVTGFDRSGGRNEGRGDLFIELPRLDGLEVRNAGGPVVLDGVTGAVTVVNRSIEGEAARIEWKTGEPVVGPVALTTDRGRVSVAMPAGGALDLDLATEAGKASFATRQGRVRDVRAGDGMWRGSWNDGIGPMLVRSGGGDVTVLVMERPLTHAFADRFTPVRGESRR